MKDSLTFAHIEYSIATKSIDIFNIGCGKGVADLNAADYDGCKGCCNPEIRDWDKDGQTPSQVFNKVKELTYRYDVLVDRILLVGGDPVDAYNRFPEQMSYFIKQLRKLNKPIFLFTRHELNAIPIDILELVDYVKTGPYIPELSIKNYKEEGILLATSNQHIHKVSEVLKGEIINGNQEIFK